MIIEVHVKTNSNVQRIVKLSNRHYRAFLNSIPEKGKANKELITLLSEFFNTPKTSIVIKKGLSSVNKLIELPKIEQ
jgi:uncharacterized protein YggU (UPF0235/DUF167 family)